MGWDIGRKDMKKIIAAALLLAVTWSPAFADWLTIFTDTYREKGIDLAVENAIKGGTAPDIIVEQAITFDGLNPQNLVKALYCAGARGQDIVAAAEKFEISELIVTAGYQNSVEECGDRVTDVQPYNVIERTRPTPPPDPKPDPPPYVSASQPLAQ